MTSPAANPPRPGNFVRFLDEHLREAEVAKTTAAHALRIGVIPEEIIDYVRGQVADRRSTESMLARSPWAMSRVVALVKSRRNPHSLGARILASKGAIQPLAWGIRGVGDHDQDVAELLDRV